jgi:CRP/FNR family cyclic AMP-dependent transcriptional regulator
MELRPTIEHFSDGGRVFRQGDLGDRMYIIMSGAVRIYREDNGAETTLAELGFGETFGELSLFDQHPRSASATAVGDTELRVLSYEEFMELDCDLIIRRMLIALAQRLRAIDEAFEQLSLKEAPEREALAELMRQRNWVG